MVFRNSTEVQCGLGIVRGQTCLCVGAGKWQVNDGLYAEVPLWCASVWKLYTARMGLSVGRLPQEVLLEEIYRSECSETVRVGRVRVFQEIPTVLKAHSVLSVLTPSRSTCDEQPLSAFSFCHITIFKTRNCIELCFIEQQEVLRRTNYPVQSCLLGYTDV
jgi:hypothetical protein